MCRIGFLTICTVYLITAPTLLLRPAHAGAPDAEVSHERGIAVLASSIGKDFTPESLAEFVRQCRFSPVVVDWAWITFHWDRTNFAAVNQFLELMGAGNAPVAAMYRPRFLSNPTVPTQMAEDGKRGVDHAEICYSDPSARQWGISWGERILEKCPSFREIIIYNPLNTCHCPNCAAAAANEPHAAVMSFLSEAKSAWRATQPGVKLGVVHMPVPDFWRAGLAVVDVAHPYLCIRENVDPATEVANIQTVRSIVKEKMGSCLGKITWEEGAKVSVEKLKRVDDLAGKAGVSYFFWTFETLFKSSLYDPKAVVQELGIGASPTATGESATTRAAAKGAENKSVDESLLKSFNDRLEQMMDPDRGSDKLADLDWLIQKAKEADADTRSAIISSVAAAMNDKQWPEYPRWLCCKVLTSIGDERAVPEVIKALLGSDLEILRYVAAGDLADLYSKNRSREIHEAFLQAARKETSERVRGNLAQVLGQEMPAAVVAGQTPGTVAGPASQPNSGYTSEEIRSTSVETFLRRMLQPQPGYHQFSAMWALTQKAKESDAESRRAILSLVIAAMQDKNRAILQRWQCCYVLSGCGDEQAVPHLIEVLLHDESDVMRSVAAEALADFPNSAEAHDALLQAAREETSPTVREVLHRRLGQASPAPKPVSAGVNELAPSGSPQPPPGPARPVAKALPWPFPGGQEDQHIFNNYQQATDSYIHCGLDFIHPAGTPVTAVGEGYVAAIFTNYPDWLTHHCFIVTPVKGSNRGWCYTHVDPRTFTFKRGDFVRRGQRLGSLVDFSVGDQPGVAHLHLHYVTFARDATGKVDVHSLLDPLYFFDWKDTEPPVFQALRFVQEGTAQEFQADAAGVVTVGGRVDILAAIADGAFRGHMGNLGVPVLMLSISDGTHTMQKLVLDHRGDVGDERQTKPLYLSYEEKKAFLNPDSFPRYQVLRVTKTDGDGKITPRDATECWDTTARDRTGTPLWPEGRYSVNVYAWDIAGNRAVAGAIVQVKNGGGAF